MTKLYAQRKDVFDINKVTVVGNPTITSDGVASGFSSGNYITAPNTFLTADTWKIEAPIPQGQTSLAGFICILADTCFQLNYDASNKKFYYTLSSNNLSWDIANSNFTISGLDLTLNPIMIVEFTGTKYIFNVKQNGTILTGIEITSSSKLYNSSNNIGIGINRGINYPTDGSIDLTTFKIYVDNELVYSPTKPVYALERRKPKVWNKGQFTIVGNPSVSESGVASGFSKNDYIQTSINLSYSNTCKIIFPFTTSNELTTQNRVYYFGNSESAITLGLSNLYRPTIVWSTVDDLTAIRAVNADYNLIINTSYLVKLEDNGENYSISIKKETDNDWTLLKTQVKTTNLKLSGTLTIGRSLTADYPFIGSIDLKQFKIYTDNNLVFDGGAETYVYDASKFTVVGSPTITEYGVASGFSGSNYLTIPKEVINSLIGHKWRIDYKIKKPVTTANALTRKLLGNQYYAPSQGSTQPINLGRFNQNYFWFANVMLDDGSYTTNFYNTMNKTSTGDMIGYLEFDGAKYTNAINEDGKWKISSYSSTLSFKKATEDLYLGYNLEGSSIDLSQFSITVDGKEVFTGAKEKYYAMRGGI